MPPSRCPCAVGEIHPFFPIHMSVYDFNLVKSHQFNPSECVPRLMKSVNNFAASLLRISLSKLILFDKHRPEINGRRVFWRHCASLCGFAPICMDDTSKKNGRVRRKPLAEILFRLLWLAPHFHKFGLFVCVWPKPCSNKERTTNSMSIQFLLPGFSSACARA